MTTWRCLVSRLGVAGGRLLRPLGWIGLGVLVGVLVLATQRPAHALPEYAARTGQQCTTCHVNPAGGGPRTLRGLLWLAQGRPDQVPPLPGSEQAAGEGGLDGAGLYEKLACAGCHGPNGEGGVGPALNQAELPAEELAGIMRNGIGIMNGYGVDVMSDQELDVIVQYVQAIGRGEVKPSLNLQKQLLPPAQLSCGSSQGTGLGLNNCSGN